MSEAVIPKSILLTAWSVKTRKKRGFKFQNSLVDQDKQGSRSVSEGNDIAYMQRVFAEHFVSIYSGTASVKDSVVFQVVGTPLAHRDNALHRGYWRCQCQAENLTFRRKSELLGRLQK